MEAAAAAALGSYGVTAQGSALVDMEIQEMLHGSKIQRNLTVLTLLEEMCNELGHACFRSASHILEFVQVG